MKTRILLIIGLLLSILGLGYVAHNIQFHGKNIKTNINKKYLQQLHEQEVALWNEITQKTGIKQEEYSQRICENKKRYIDPCLSKNIIKIIDEVLVDFNVNPETISLYVKDDNRSAAAVARPDEIYIHEDLLSAYSIEAQKFIIGHELQNILDNDPYVFGAIYQALNLNNETELNNQFSKFMRFTELRADIKTMLHPNPLYNRGAIEYNKHNLKTNGEHNENTHPKYSKRLEIAQAIQAQAPSTEMQILA